MHRASMSTEDETACRTLVAHALADFQLEDEATIAIDRPLKTLGMNSLVAMVFRIWVAAGWRGAEHGCHSDEAQLSKSPLQILRT